MTHIATQRLHGLKRPKILVQAARHGANDYQRKTHLPQLFGWRIPNSAGTLFDILFEKEAELNKMRRLNNAAYQVQDHIAILTALLAEARNIPSPAQPLAA